MFESVGCNTFACHGSMLAPGGVLVYLPDPTTGYADMLERQSFREARVILRPGAPDESVLVTHGETTLVEFQVIDATQAALVRRLGRKTGAAFRRSPEPSDAGVADSGSEPTTCSLADGRGLPALPATCLPRCARATWDAVIACRTAPDPASCQDQAMAADPTPTTDLATGDDQVPIDCQACVNWQTSRLPRRVLSGRELGLPPLHQPPARRGLHRGEQRPLHLRPRPARLSALPTGSGSQLRGPVARPPVHAWEHTPRRSADELG
jgi:hypothetical protein